MVQGKPVTPALQREGQTAPSPCYASGGYTHKRPQAVFCQHWFAEDNAHMAIGG